MTRPLATLAAFPEDSAWFPAPAWQLAVVYNYSFRDPVPSLALWGLHARGALISMQQQDTHTHKTKVNL